MNELDFIFDSPVGELRLTADAVARLVQESLCTGKLELKDLVVAGESEGVQAKLDVAADDHLEWTVK